jgi:hypothetical protein
MSVLFICGLCASAGIMRDVDVSQVQAVEPVRSFANVLEEEKRGNSSMKEIMNSGEWKQIMDFMIGENPPFGFEFMSSPPITRNSDGSLNVRTPTGSKKCSVGDFLQSVGSCKYDVRSEHQHGDEA